MPSHSRSSRIAASNSGRQRAGSISSMRRRSLPPQARAASTLIERRERVAKMQIAVRARREAKHGRRGRLSQPRASRSAFAFSTAARAFFVIAAKRPSLMSSARAIQVPPTAMTLLSFSQSPRLSRLTPPVGMKARPRCAKGAAIASSAFGPPAVPAGKEFHDAHALRHRRRHIARRHDARREGKLRLRGGLDDACVKARREAKARAAVARRFERGKVEHGARAGEELRPLGRELREHRRRGRRAEGDLGDRQPAFEKRVGERDGVLGAFDGDDRNDADRGDRPERVGHAGLGVSAGHVRACLPPSIWFGRGACRCSRRGRRHRWRFASALP